MATWGQFPSRECSIGGLWLIWPITKSSDILSTGPIWPEKAYLAGGTYYRFTPAQVGDLEAEIKPVERTDE